MSQQNTYQMNSRDTSNNNSNNNRNPFQRNGRSNGSGRYKDWKNGSVPYQTYGSAPVKPKEKVLTADDFPVLPGATPSQAKGVWGLQSVPAKRRNSQDSDDTAEVTLVDRVKGMIAKEEEGKLKQLVEKKEEEILDVIPLSNWLRSKQMAKEREEQMKKREWEAYEENYRWQISREMIPPKPEPEMPEYDEEFYEEGGGYGVEFLEEVVEEQ